MLHRRSRYRQAAESTETRIWILNDIRRSSRIDCWPLDDLSFALSWTILEKKGISFKSFIHISCFLH